MNWLYYLLEANLYLAAFYLMYKLLLQNSTFYNGNRYFLILSIATAFIIPLMQLGFLKPQAFIAPELDYYAAPLEKLEIKPIEKVPELAFEDYVVYFYITFAFFFGLRFLISISKIAKIYFSNKKHKSGKYTLVELPTEQTAFSFFNLLFIHPNMAKNEAVLTHEKTHIREKHSIDIILLELLKIICWFNPIIYFIKNDLKLLHEYIADENTTMANISKHEYAIFLIENAISAFSPSLVNQFFNQPILKNRINMLNKEKTANWARLKYLLAAPLGVGLLCVSTLSFSKTYAYIDLFPKKNNVAKTVVSKVTEEKAFYPKNEHSLSKELTNIVEKRHIVINGKPLVDVAKFYGIAQAKNITYLSIADAIKKFGDKGKYGAVEITGNNLKYLEFDPPALPKKSVKAPKKAITPTHKAKLKNKNDNKQEKQETNSVIAASSWSMYLPFKEEKKNEGC